MTRVTIEFLEDSAIRDDGYKEKLNVVSQLDYFSVWTQAGVVAIFDTGNNRTSQNCY